MHYRQCFDSEYLGNWDLPRDRDCVVEIERVAPGTLTGARGKKDKKAIVHFRGKQKGMAFNITNAKTVAAMYGPDTRAWIGKSIALYVTTTDSPSGQVDCIRVRPTVPRAEKAGKKNGSKAAPEPEPLPEAAAEPDPPDYVPEEPPPGALESDHEQQ